MLKSLSKQSFLFILVVIIFSTSLQAQTSENISLSVYMSRLEKQHSIRFSYAPKDVENITILTPLNDLSLQAIIEYLNTNTPLTFTQIDTRYITVIAKNNTTMLCGKVIDALSGFPVAGANVISARDFSAVSDTEGLFYIPNDKISEKITVQHLGYNTVTLSTNSLSTDCEDILLHMQVSVLNPISITGFLTRGITKQLDGSILIDTEDFGLLPGQVEGDVLQIAQALPGVESADETISNINIRGGTHDENGIFWDDIKMYQSGHFFGLISAFNPNLTQKVTLYKNGTHPRYGENTSGVIAMRSKDKIAKAFTGGAGFNLINTQAFAEIPLSERLGIQITGRRGITNFLRSPVYDIYTERIFQDSEITNVENNAQGADVTSKEEFNFYDLSTKILWDFSEKDKLRVNFLTIDNSIEFTETLQSSSLSETSKLGQRSVVGGVSWNRIWNPTVKTTSLIYGSYYLLDAVNEDILTTQKQEQKNEVVETGLKFDAFINLSERFNLETGYHFSETGISNTQEVNLPRFRIFEKDVLRTHIVFGNMKFHSQNELTHINFGIRTNYFTKFQKFLVEPRLSINQKIAKGLAIEVLGELKSQTTTQRIDFESDFLGVEKRRWILANEDNIPIINSKQVSLGLVYNKFNWFINLEGFYKFVDGIITSNQGFQNQFQFAVGDGNYDVKGVEVVLNKKGKFFSTWLAYSYMSNNYTFQTLTPTRFPNNIDITHTASIASSFSLKKLKLSMGINWHSGKPYTIPVAGNELITENGSSTIQYNVPNAERLPDYFRTNLSAEYLWMISEKFDAKINVAILNVFDTKNTINIRYAIDTDENGDNRVNQIEEISLGFTPNFSFQFLF